MALGTTDTAAVNAAMRSMPVDDFMTHGAPIRADGRVERDMYLVQVKTPAESHGPWDYFKVIRTLPGATLITPISETACPTAR